MKDGIAEPRKDIHAAVMNTHATTEELLQAMSSMQSVSMLCKENQPEFSISRESEGFAIMG
jgi:hypothetical protein